MKKHLQFRRFIFGCSFLVFLGCNTQKAPPYEILDGKVYVMAEVRRHGGGMDVIPSTSVIINSIEDEDKEYRGLLMPTALYITTVDNKEIKKPVESIRNSSRYRLYGYHRTLTEVQERYKAAGGTETYYPARIFEGTDFFDIHEMEELP